MTDSAQTREWYKLSETGRQEKILEQLKRIFATAKLKNLAAIDEVDGYEEFMWPPEEYSNGCVPSLPPNSMKELEVRNTTVDDMLFFGGTALAPISIGYVDGALHSGERTACQALSSINVSAGVAPVKVEQIRTSSAGYLPCILRMLLALSAETLAKRKGIKLEASPGCCS